MNVGEYGIAFNLGVGYDISGSSSLSLAFTRPDGSVFTATNPQVAAGTVDITNGTVSFPAKQYAQYAIGQGLLTIPGQYSARLTYTDATKLLKSDTVTFTVNP